MPLSILLHFQIFSFTRSIDRLGAWLSLRLKGARQAELASRAFPVLRFYNGAVCLAITPSQFGALAPRRQSQSFWATIGESFAQGGRRFIGGFEYIATAVRQELLLPRTLGAVRDIIALVEDSIQRFQQPNSSLFDLNRRRTASDLFGEVGLLYRAFSGSTDQVVDMVHDIERVRNAVRRSLPPSKPVPAAEEVLPRTAPPARSQSTVGLLDDVCRGITGAILLLPVLPGILVPLFQAFQLRFMETVVDFMAGIEHMVFDLRRSIIDFFHVDLRRMGRNAYDFLIAAAVVIIPFVAFAQKFIVNALTKTLLGFQNYLHRISTLLNIVTRVLEGIRRLIEGILNFDLAPLIGGAIPALLGVLPRLTIDDLITMLTGLGLAVLRTAIIGALLTAQAAISAAPDAVSTLGILAGPIGSYVADEVSDAMRPTTEMLARRIGAAIELFNLTLRQPTMLPRSARWNPVINPLPDIYTAIFGPAFVTFRDSLTAMRDTAIRGIFHIMGAGAVMIDDLGSACGIGAGAFAALGSPGRFRAIIADADRWSDDLYGTQARELMAAISSRHDILAEAFENNIANQGFTVVAAVLPGYVEQMIRYWSREAPAQAPTSPHIMAANSRLRRCHLDEAIVDARRQPLDGGLAQRIAQGFAGRLREACAPALGTV
jgi:hypothetical protein